MIENSQKRDWRIRHPESPSIINLFGMYILEGKKGTSGERRDDQLEIKKTIRLFKKGEGGYVRQVGSGREGAETLGCVPS